MRCTVLLIVVVRDDNHWSSSGIIIARGYRYRYWGAANFSSVFDDSGFVIPVAGIRTHVPNVRNLGR